MRGRKSTPHRDLPIHPAVPIGAVGMAPMPMTGRRSSALSIGRRANSGSGCVTMRLAGLVMACYTRRSRPRLPCWPVMNGVPTPVFTATTAPWPMAWASGHAMMTAMADAKCIVIPAKAQVPRCALSSVPFAACTSAICIAISFWLKRSIMPRPFPLPSFVGCVLADILLGTLITHEPPFLIIQRQNHHLYRHTPPYSTKIYGIGWVTFLSIYRLRRNRGLTTGSRPSDNNIKVNAVNTISSPGGTIHHQ